MAIATVTRYKLPDNTVFIDARVRGAVIGVKGANTKRIASVVGGRCYIRINNETGSLHVSAENIEAVREATRMVKQDEQHFLDPRVPSSKPSRNIPYGKLVLGMGPVGLSIVNIYPERVVVGTLIGKGGENRARILRTVGDGADFIHIPSTHSVGSFQLSGNTIATIDKLVTRLQHELKLWYDFMMRRSASFSAPTPAVSAPASGFAVLAEDDSDEPEEKPVETMVAVKPAEKPAETKVVTVKPVERKDTNFPDLTGMVVVKKDDEDLRTFLKVEKLPSVAVSAPTPRKLPTVVRPTSSVVETGFDDTRSLANVRLMERIKKAIYIQLRQAHVARVGTTEIRDKRTGEKKTVPKEPFALPDNFHEMVEEVYGKMKGVSRAARPVASRGLSEKDFAVSLSKLAPSAGAWSSRTTSALKEELAAATEAGIGFVETEKARAERLERERREREEEAEFVRISKAKKDARAGVSAPAVVETVVVDMDWADFDTKVAEAMTTLGFSAPFDLCAEWDGVRPDFVGTVSDDELAAEWEAISRRL
jgi:hypothetical protein